MIKRRQLSISRIEKSKLSKVDIIRFVKKNIEIQWKEKKLRKGSLALNAYFFIYIFLILNYPIFISSIKPK